MTAAQTRLRSAAFLDRDGVINVDHGYTFRPEDLILTPTAAEGIRLLNEAGLLVVVVTNQSGVARGLYGAGDVERFHEAMQSALLAQGARIDAFYYCAYHPAGTVVAFARDHDDRKPGPGMVLRAMADLGIGREGSVMIGDKASDVEAARRAGIPGIRVPANVCDLAATVREILRDGPTEGGRLDRGHDGPTPAGPQRGIRVKAYRDWIMGTALPFWADAGFDEGRNRFRERLDLAGQPMDVPHRSMVQARQIYVYATAERLGWHKGGGALAERAMATLLGTFRREADGRAAFLFSVDGRGTPVSDARDAYAHAFVLFALAALHQLNGDPALLEVADRTIAFIDAELTDPEAGGLFDALPVVDGTKRQNPLMHLLEAYLFLDMAAPGRGYLERAATLVDLFDRRLFRPDPGVILEYFGADWSPHATPERAGLWEPGHHFEWVWLLDAFARRSGTDRTASIATLHRMALDHGIAPDGLIHDEVDLALAPVRSTHRIWPHTEAIKAAAVRHATGDRTAASLAESMATRLLDTFLDRPFAGGWIDQVDEAGTPLSDFVPASSLYHLFFAATEHDRLAAPIT